MAYSPLATISLIFLLSALCGLYSATSNDDDISVDLADDDEPDMFVPTREWQKVGKNTLLPSGLHIRINLETGEKEAKLPDDGNLVQEEEAVQEVDRFKDRRRLKNYGHSDRSGIVNKKTAVFTKHEFRNVLRGSNVDVDESNTDELKLISHSAGSQSNTESHAGLSSPDSLAADDKPVQFEGKFLTKEQQLMLGCFDALHDTQSSEETINTNLEELEYFVHSIENGEFFATTGGLSLMLTFLNHTNSAMRSLAAQVIGSAVQSNPRVQKQALQLGVLEALLPGLSYHKSDLEQRRSLYALSNFLRRYFPAQEKFIVQLSGFDAIIDHSKDKSLKFQLKAVVILTDILNEFFEDSSGEKESMMGLRLLNTLPNTDWCHMIAGLLYGNELDYIQKALEGMFVCYKVCNFTPHVGRLRDLRSSWEEVDNSVHVTLTELTTKMIRLITANHSLHEEL